MITHDLDELYDKNDFLHYGYYIVQNRISAHIHNFTYGLNDNYECLNKNRHLINSENTSKETAYEKHKFDEMLESFEEYHDQFE